MTMPTPPEEVLRKGLSLGQRVKRIPGRTFFSFPPFDKTRLDKTCMDWTRLRTYWTGLDLTRLDSQTGLDWTNVPATNQPGSTHFPWHASNTQASHMVLPGRNLFTMRHFWCATNLPGTACFSWRVYRAAHVFRGHHQTLSKLSGCGSMRTCSQS